MFFSYYRYRFLNNSSFKLSCWQKYFVVLNIKDFQQIVIILNYQTVAYAYEYVNVTKVMKTHKSEATQVCILNKYLSLLHDP